MPSLARAVATVMLLALALPVACESEAGPAGPAATGSGTVTLHGDQSVVFRTGEVRFKADYTADLYATGGSRGGSGLKLTPGGPSPTHSRPANWFQGAGGTCETFAGLDAVPHDKPTGAEGFPLIGAKTGNGFVLLDADGTYTVGWIELANATTVVIQYEPLVE